MMKKMERLCSLALLLLLVALSAISSYPAHAKIEFADTYVNAATGSDDNPGNSPTFPVKTIAEAINRTATSGTIHVAAGTYNEHNLDLNNTMNMLGAGALTTIIDANSHGKVLAVSSAPGQQNTISGFTIKGGHPSGSDPGGGIYISLAHIVTLNDCAIVGNFRGTGAGSALGTGGGVCCDGGTLYMNRCTVSGNGADLLGGGVAVLRTGGGDSGLLQMTNCTISGNSVLNAGGAGGGLYCNSDTNVHLLNVTIANNRAIHPVSVGGGFSNGSISSLYLKNCIVANNTAGITETGNQYNSLATGTHSEGNNLCSGGLTYFDQASDQNNVDPQLGTLQNNGGQTSTCAITRNSLAYGHGNRSGAPDTDQRGILRPSNTCSIGAFEPAVPTIISVNPNYGTQGQTLNNVIITGTNLTSAAGVSFGDGIAIKSFNAVSSTQITVNITISMAAIGARNVSVTTPEGTCTLTNGFTVLPGQANLHSQSSTGTSQGPVQLSSISVTSSSLSATTVSPGTPVTVTANVANTGAVNGNASIKVYVNGQVESTRGVTVNSGSSTPVTFSVTRDEPGTYSVYVGGTNAGSFTVDALADPNLILIVSGALILFAFVVGIIFIIRRRQAY
jgi:hypothetical protein